MTNVLKMDIMHGPLSYLDRDGEINIPCNTHFLQSYVNYNASPPYKMFWAEFPQDKHPLLLEKIIVKEADHFVNSQLKRARGSFYKKIKNIIANYHPISYSLYNPICFFHPTDLVSTPKKFSKLEAEAKEKDINLISIYHTLKDFNFRTKDEVKELCRELHIPEYVGLPTHRDIDIAMFRYTHDRYRKMIEKYEKLKEVS